MRLRRKTPRQLQVERTLRALEDGDLQVEGQIQPFSGVRPGELKVALTVAPVTPVDTAQSVSRPTYSGYHDGDAPGWAPAKGGATENLDTVEFGACTAGSDMIVGFALYDDVTDEIIASGTIPALHIDGGTTPMFAAGAMTVTIS